MELNSIIKDALTSINFVSRYEELSQSFTVQRIPLNQRLIYIDGEMVLEIIEKLGYKATFEPKEKFYKTHNEQIGRFTARIHIILTGGMVDLVWVVSENEELLLGSPWGTYSKRLIASNYRIKKPVYGSYDHLEEKLKVSFEMYEDFKKELKNC